MVGAVSLRLPWFPVVAALSSSPLMSTVPLPHPGYPKRLRQCEWVYQQLSVTE